MFNKIMPGNVHKITIDNKDNVIISEQNGDRLWKASPSLEDIVQLDLKNVLNPKYHENYLYVFCKDTNSINRIKLSGNVVVENKQIITDLDYRWYAPVFNFNNKGNLVLCYNNIMQEYDFDGTLVKNISQNNTFDQREMAIDADDNIYISSVELPFVKVYDKFMELKKHSVHYPPIYSSYGLGIDRYNNLYTGNFKYVIIRNLNNNIRKTINADDKQLLFGFAFNSRNDLYIACHYDINVYGENYNF